MCSLTFYTPCSSEINSDITIDIISDIISDHAHAKHMTSCDHCVTIVFSKYQLIYININGCL